MIDFQSQYFLENLLLEHGHLKLNTLALDLVLLSASGNSDREWPSLQGLEHFLGWLTENVWQSQLNLGMALSTT